MDAFDFADLLMFFIEFLVLFGSNAFIFLFVAYLFDIIWRQRWPCWLDKFLFASGVRIGHPPKLAFDVIALGLVETSWVLQFAFWLEEVDKVIGILVKAGAYTDGLREAWEDGLDLQGAGYTNLLSSSLWAVIRFLHVVYMLKYPS